MNGVVVVDKPAHITSAQVVARLKKILRAKKVGHTGTLDPFATGVLVCCVNAATRVARFLMHGKKRYEGVMQLGIRTDTQDATGQVLSRQSHATVTDQEIRSAFRRFSKITGQIPPAFSALKHHGEPLYKLARKGVFVQKPSRRISIYKLEIVDVEIPYVHFDVICSHGTYVRTLCSDIGEYLGCGASLVQLCRTENGGFTLEDAFSLNTLERLARSGKLSTCIIPTSDALREIPEVTVSDQLAKKIQHGQPLSYTELEIAEEVKSLWLKIIDGQRNLIAVLNTSKKNGNGVYPYACVFPRRESRKCIEQSA